MAKIAILGFGTVGSGVLEVTRRNAQSIQKRANQALEVKYILDVRDFSTHPDAHLFVKDIDTIVADAEVEVVVETIGGTKFAYPFVCKALQAGKSVVTSNKEMVATYGDKLLALAKESGVAFLFEASVGGGTPIIAPLHENLCANTISGVQGIVNGTTNFMLTKMATENMGFAEALKIAQDLGYAETKDPSDDVDGLDAGRKIAILASIAFGKHVHPQNIQTSGIRPITVADIKNAASLDCVIKLIAWCKQDANGGVVAGVEPMLVPQANLLAGVNGVYNAVMVKADMLGDVVLYGQGAGSLATASAVVADAVEAVREKSNVHQSLFWQPSEPAEGKFVDETPATYYLRTKNIPASVLPNVYGDGELLADNGTEAAYLVTNIAPTALYAANRQAEALGGSVELVLRRMAD